MRKITSLIIVVIIAVSILTSCSENSSNTYSATTASPKPTPELTHTPTPTPYIDTNDPNDPKSSKYLGYYCSKDELASTMGFTDDEIEELVTKYIKDKDCGLSTEMR